MQKNTQKKDEIDYNQFIGPRYKVFIQNMRITLKFMKEIG